MCMCANVDGLVPCNTGLIDFLTLRNRLHVTHRHPHTRISTDSQSKTHLVTPLSTPVPPVEKAIFLLFHLY